MGGVAHVHAGIVQDEIADIDEVAVEDQSAHGFGHVAARLPARRQARGLEPGVEAQDGNGHPLEPSGDMLPRQLRQLVAARHPERLV
jgi:hypothetical protein